MASKALSKLQAIRIFLGSSPKPFQVIRRRFGTMATYDEAAETAKQGRDAAKKVGQQVLNEAATAADNVAHKTKGMAEKASETAQDAAGKVKQAAEDTWNSIKDTTGNIKNAAEATAESGPEVKEQAAKIERCMNSKKPE